MIPSSSRRRLPVLALALLAASALMWAGCGHDGDQLAGPPADGSDDAALAFGPRNPEIAAAMVIQDRHTPELLADEDVVGTATGLDEAGVPVIRVYLARPVPAGRLPESLDGVRVVPEVTGEIRALKGPPGGNNGGDDPRALQTPPVKMGTSGGWRYDLANGFCCGGTLGALIQVGANKRILSNYHVLEADVVNGDNGHTAQTGDPVIQPALIDVNCNANAAQDVATLVVTASLPSSNVDASSANVIPGMVDESGAILSIGVPSSATVGASVRQEVKKMGRTTGLTRSRVDGLNASIQVTYENECAGGTAFTKVFTGQIIVRNKGQKFLAGGDSGSVMYEDVDTAPRAVGLLFAGGSTIGVANPIDEVLAFFGASMVGS